MAEGEITTFAALTERFNLPLGNYKKPKLLYCSNGGHFLRILPDGTVDGTRDRSDQHTPFTEMSVQETQPERNPVKMSYETWTSWRNNISRGNS
ncbi:fibroblast growth factor 1 isoform X3 [Rattus rattus]|uniref:fibroblast growth factor 1 isoform X3 n=1 Tax=Rattus rattus TaxID=10117 RepID=UPI0013F3731A|nr:fibroblast growth factor 1 isoform X3 [Rattus rattus]